MTEITDTLACLKRIELTLKTIEELLAQFIEKLANPQPDHTQTIRQRLLNLRQNSRK